MSELRALLLTDAVDSTHLAESLGDVAMGEHWARHDRAARDLLPAWRGREIDKTDGLLLMFDTAADAVGFALAYHRALAQLGLPFKARAGLHVGPVTLRENSAADVARGAKPIEVDGVAKSIAARVMQTAQGGQTLLSADARLALGPSPWRVQSHGHWRLQGLAEPIELFEVGDGVATPPEASAPFTPPPDHAKAYRVAWHGGVWLPVREVRHSMPAERDSFVGRADSLAELSRRLNSGARLVSVLGMGGTGKTRLVTRFAWTWLGDYPGGVWFCDLSQARSADGIAFAVAQGLGVPLGKSDPVVHLGNAINGRGKCLVILDNFEQVARHAEETLGRWLDRAAQAQFVVTTREVLGIPGEQTMALAPLPESAATALFMQRAHAACADFSPTADDAAAIGPLVKLLDGLPLAIELAAARVRLMSPRALLMRMGERFRLLSSRGARQDRQATLRATFDWSWDLLTAPEKATLAQLSVFVGGFTLAASEAVVDLSKVDDPPTTLDALQSLVDKSFVRRVSPERFELLESVREYAEEHLRSETSHAGSGAVAQARATLRHSLHYAEPANATGTDDVTVDVENVVAACRRAAARGDSATAARAFERAWGALVRCGPFRVAIELATLVDATPDITDAAKARLDQSSGQALVLCGEVGKARSRLEAACALASRIGDRLIEARACLGLAELNGVEGRMEEATSQYERALTLADALGQPPLQCAALNGLGTLSEHLGDFKRARHHYEAALNIADRAADKRWQCGTLGNLGQLHANVGDAGKALPLYEASVALARNLGDRQWEGNMLCNLGLLHHAEGRLEPARAHLEQALVLARNLGYTGLESVVLCNLGIVHDTLGQRGLAQQHYEAALRIARDRNDRRSEGQFQGYLGLSLAREGRHAQAMGCLDAGDKVLRDIGDRVSLGILLCSRAEAASMAGDPQAALIAFEEAAALATETAAEPDSEFGISLRQAKSQLSSEVQA